MIGFILMLFLGLVGWWGGYWCGRLAEMGEVGSGSFWAPFIDTWRIVWRGKWEGERG